VHPAKRSVIYLALTSVLAISPALAEGTRTEFDAPAEEMQWALDRGMSWGSIAVLAYIRATTGESFATLDRDAAEKDPWAYVDKAGMNPDKMVRSLAQFLKRVEEERNTRIFERVRASRRVSRMPDLGSGFGLLQETLDFRRLETPKPTKIHTNP
jgi:hypothetical protein